MTGAPVIDGDGRFEGTISATSLDRASGDDDDIRGLADAGAPTIGVTSSLDVALDALTTGGASFVPVLDGDRQVRGTLAVSDLVRTYRSQLLAHLRTVQGPTDKTGTASEIEVRPQSPLADTPLRQAVLPHGVVITAVRRDGDVLAPKGDTVIQVGDRLSVIGQGAAELDGAVPRERRGPEGTGA